MGMELPSTHNQWTARRGGRALWLPRGQAWDGNSARMGGAAPGEKLPVPESKAGWPEQGGPWDSPGPCPLSSLGPSLPQGWPHPLHSGLWITKDLFGE